jgi:hypothetical protein
VRQLEHAHLVFDFPQRLKIHRDTASATPASRRQYLSFSAAAMAGPLEI